MVEFVWYDFASMPQRDPEAADGDGRTAAERAEFAHMLGAIVDLYLTCNVRLLL